MCNISRFEISYVGLASLQCTTSLDVIALQKKPVVQLKAASAINRIMVLCDATLSLLNMLNLEVCGFDEHTTDM